MADVHHLGLTAMEVQFIKVNPLTRHVLDEEVGRPARELPQLLPVNVGSEPDQTAPSAEALATPLRRRDSITTLTWSLAKDYADLELSRNLARGLDVDLTLHAPYYVDFFGSTDSREQSTRQIQWSGVLAHGLGARLAVTHLGFYGPGQREDSIQALTETVLDLSKWLATFSKGKVRLGIEPSGHPDVFGSRQEILDLVRRAKGTVPVLNLPHLAARERTTFEEAEDLEPILKEFVRATDGPLYLNFSGVEFYGPGEFRLTPIKRGLVRFDPLAELLAERDYDVTVISSSPLLEHDGMYMKLLYERALSRRYARLHPASGARAPAKAPATAASRPRTVAAVTPPKRRGGIVAPKATATAKARASAGSTTGPSRRAKPPRKATKSSSHGGHRGRRR